MIFRFSIVVISFLVFAQGVFSATKMEKMESALASMQEGSKGHLNLYLQIQRKNYLSRDWGKVFSYAQFYRLNILSKNQGPKEFKRTFRAPLVIIEILALGRFCRFNLAKRVYQSMMEKRSMMSSEQIKMMEDAFKGLGLIKKIKELEVSNETSIETKKKNKRVVLWPVRKKTSSKFKRPYYTRVLLENKCLK